ncbi:MAG: DNA cytosine methyltransferase [Chloroflexi bacterium]|nr:DNA cytosine methyltransferase [Chloroflexota bacterium]
MSQVRKRVERCTVVDLFAGAGGLTHGFVLEGFRVGAGVEADEAFRYAYEKNNPGVRFIHAKIETMTPDDLLHLYPKGDLKILAGCAPCQPFSSYTRLQGKHQNWQLLYEFADLIEAIQPEIVTMENVPRLETYDNGAVFHDFLKTLEKHGYFVTYAPRVYAPNYGVPQHRYRLILIASKLGYVEFLRPSRQDGNYLTVRDAIGNLEPLRAGETSKHDPLHRTMGLSPLNLKRIKASKPGGTWFDWPDELRATCHTKETGRTYKNVYGRMSWNEPSPTITTQCYGFGNGRFGHPKQNRAISMREAALLQTFPSYYEFFDPAVENSSITKFAQMIGNAVPVALARMIAKSIRLHILHHRGWLWKF